MKDFKKFLKLYKDKLLMSAYSLLILGIAITISILTFPEISAFLVTFESGVFLYSQYRTYFVKKNKPVEFPDIDISENTSEDEEK